ncbi:MAG TPA: hypothetical protein VM369_02390 [Candidatus Binatia bacterium]|nr:hypothetical protein [Candidatus Binatia bacterium]
MQQPGHGGSADQPEQGADAAHARHGYGVEFLAPALRAVTGDREVQCHVLDQQMTHRAGYGYRAQDR